MTFRSDCPKFHTGRFSPLRYPGGKGKLARFIKNLINLNGLADGLYVEPYAGGAAIACELLLTGVMRRVHINDFDPAIFSFWSSITTSTEEFQRMLWDAPVTVEEWERQKQVFKHEKMPSLELGFAMFFLNRTNRSGILNAGPIGGKKQTGDWLIDARFNKGSLAPLISAIANQSSRIIITREDAIDLPDKLKLNHKSLVYYDPPYYLKGKHLYHNHYNEGDHKDVADHVKSLRHNWIVSYDDVQPIHALYGESALLRYQIGYSARNVIQGREAMFFSPGLSIPDVCGSMREVERRLAAPNLDHHFSTDR